VFDRLVACADVEEHVVLGSSVGFLALHGGIEPGTEGIARTAAARTGGSAYVVTQPRSRGWHVPSHRIDTAAVPGLAAFLAHVDVVVSVHGYYLPDQPDAILVGGGRRDLAADLAARLRDCVDEMPVVDELDRIPRAWTLATRSTARVPVGSSSSCRTGPASGRPRPRSRPSPTGSPPP